MGLDQSLFTPTGEEAYFRKKYVLNTFFHVHSYNWSDPNDKWAPDENRIDVKDVEKLVKICRFLLNIKGRHNFIEISKRILGSPFSDDEDFNDDFISGLEQVVEQIPPILELNPPYFLYSAG